MRWNDVNWSVLSSNAMDWVGTRRNAMEWNRVRYNSIEQTGKEWTGVKGLSEMEWDGMKVEWVEDRWNEME